MAAKTINGLHGPGDGGSSRSNSRPTVMLGVPRRRHPGQSSRCTKTLTPPLSPRTSKSRTLGQFLGWGMSGLRVVAAAGTTSAVARKHFLFTANDLGIPCSLLMSAPQFGPIRKPLCRAPLLLHIPSRLNSDCQSELRGSLSTRDSRNRRTLSTYTSAKSATGLRVSISAMAASISHSVAHNTASVIIGARCTPAAQ